MYFVNNTILSVVAKKRRYYCNIYLDMRNNYQKLIKCNTFVSSSLKLSEISKYVCSTFLQIVSPGIFFFLVWCTCTEYSVRNDITLFVEQTEGTKTKPSFPVNNKSLLKDTNLNNEKRNAKFLLQWDVRLCLGTHRIYRTHADVRMGWFDTFGTFLETRRYC